MKRKLEKQPFSFEKCSGPESDAVYRDVPALSRTARTKKYLRRAYQSVAVRRIYIFFSQELLAIGIGVCGD